MLHLRTFGTLTLMDDAGSDRLATGSQPKRTALLVYAAAARPHGPVERDRLLALFWPESSSRDARGALNQALHYLRRHAGPGVLGSVGSGRITLDEGHCEVDVRRFSRAVGGEDFEEALRLYGGPFLNGFHVSGAPLFLEWLEEERAHLTNMAVMAARGAADVCMGEGRWAEATRYARKAVEWAPFDDKVLCWAIRALDRSGDQSGAICLFAEAENRLRRELEIRPPPEAEAIVQDIRAQQLDLPSTVGADPRFDPAGRKEFPQGRDRWAGGPRGEGPMPDQRSGFGSLSRRLRIPAALGAVALGALWFGSLRGPPSLDPGRLLLSATEGVPEWLVEGVQDRLARDGRDHVAVAPGRTLVSGEVPLATSVVEMARSAGAGYALLLSGDSLGIRVQIFQTETASVRGSENLTGGDSVMIDRAAGLAVLYGDTAFARWAGAISVPPGLASLLSHQRGFELLRALDIEGARSAWRRALELNPEFRLAALELMGVESPSTRASLAEFIASRYETLSTVERLHFEAWEAVDPARRPSRLSRLQEAAVLFPERYGAWGAGVATDLGEWEEALRLGSLVPPEQSLADNPFFPVVAALHALGRHEEELEVARRAVQAHQEQRINQNFEIAALAALGREAEIEEVLVDRTGWSSQKAPDLGFGIRSLAARELWMHGYQEEASAVARRGIELLLEEDTVTPGSLSSSLADFYRWSGEYGAAQEFLQITLQAYPAWFGVARDAGVIAALDGDEREAEYWYRRLADWELPPGQERYRSLALARIRAAQDRPEEAARLVTLSLAQGLSHVSLRTAPELVPHRNHPVFKSILSAPVF
jgi:DNA-binding SARP family transcriptional activator